MLIILQAVSKFQQALKIDGQAHETLWCLGNAYTSQGFLTADTDQALSFFKQARGAFEKALKEVSKMAPWQLCCYKSSKMCAALDELACVSVQDPSSDVYKKAVEMTAKVSFPGLQSSACRLLNAYSAGEQV